TATSLKATATTAKSSASASASSPAGSGSVNSGDGTWFDIGLGSCGQENTDDELVAALNAPQMMNGDNPNNNPMCGKKINVTNPATNKSVTVKIVDTCPPCSSGSVDLSPAAFKSISNLDIGRIKINW
ncbi:RlpA-like double-psi beta-barrel-protein domain-containing protein-containing protein, partial [Helicostylum pulchrum]